MNNEMLYVAFQLENIIKRRKNSDTNIRIENDVNPTSPAPSPLYTGSA